MKAVAMVMSAAYVVMGVVLLLAIGDLQHVPGTTRLLLGILMIGYGLFRAYRFWKQHYVNKEEDEA